MSSDIQVFVKWKEQTIFAGEDVECIITFKNVAETSSPDANGPQHPVHQRRASRPITAGSQPDSYFSLKSPQSFFFNNNNNNRRSIAGSPRNKAFDRSHRVSSSLGSPFGAAHSFPPQSPSNLGPGSNHKHKRSISILSIDSEGGGNDKTPVPPQLNRSRPAKGHGRSASLQILPRRNDDYEVSFSSPGRRNGRGFPSAESPLTPAIANLKVDGDPQLKISRPGSATNSPATPIEQMRNSASARRANPLPTDFKFPPPPSSNNDVTVSHAARTPSVPSVDEVPKSAKLRKPDNDRPSLPQSRLAPVTRIISDSTMNGGSRSSGEFYSQSNNSSETMGSEYTSYSLSRARSIFSKHRRHFSSTEHPARTNGTQSLLMGYAQISASFTVDGSLVNQAAFEEVKRKGVVGAQGSNGRPSGGPDKSRKSGLWGALGWSAIEDSINGLLSNGELDGLRDMRGVTSSNSIPLLSTPQSLLFVDLRLVPGEERSFSFSFTLPRGLPASHKGKAIKISYNLVIGTQRPSGPKQAQQVNRINMPFRVFSGVNSQGDVLGHDLMVPYVLLKDEARVQKLDSTPSFHTKDKSISGPTWNSASEFLSYVDEILEQNNRRNSFLSVTTPTLERRPSHEVIRSPPSCKDAIDFAILRSNQVTSTNRSTNRFEIARNGKRIAVVVLNRPAHRLGETVIATIDFTDAALPCYSLRGTLETSEKVAPALAVRSSASINRATRRIYASCFENTLYSTRVVFSPAIPVAATPTILTSGVNLEWELRFEFVTTSSHGENDLGNYGPSGAGLLETIGEDDRGAVFSSLENLSCESFEIAIPLTVYGETVREPLPEEHQGHSI
ncbi:hypothetical protein DTO021D3_430 [Paecilomyces variotii]|nr:hypothetical protein DTO032I3_339 [Paecilomyces variotii]KAJ9283093.1 hypothetical protein DTO021D3_430 [Paecilomyces variotii]KAJ9346803.1 hypothetical protein DTO027B6_370 [Paecilomyces variotii]KAJ9393645.1 hypothetical protein DTO032I4_416 [Paecilomyces variotii]